MGTNLRRVFFAPLLLLVLADTGCNGISGISTSSTSPELSLSHERQEALTSPGRLTNAPAPLITPTYDGSGQVVEPTVLYFPDGWQGHVYWMVVSPYPNRLGQSSFENPSILISEDGQNWSVPSGLQNPIAVPAQGQFADATAVYDNESNELVVYFLNDVLGSDYRESLLRMASTDGIHWTAPEVLISGHNTFVNSPTVAKVANGYDLWSVDSGEGCFTQNSRINLRTSPDGIVWSTPRVVNMIQPGYIIWHFNVIWVSAESQFMSVIAAYPLGTNCDNTKLFFANSNDGLTWQTYAEPVLEPGKGWDSLEVYRSSVIYDPGTQLFRVWYSGRDSVKWEWHAGYTQKFFLIP